MILDDIVSKTIERVELLKNNISLTDIIKLADQVKKNDFIFLKKIKNNNFSIIAEVKKASPSKGIIDKEFDYKQIALDYKKAQVDCISILTEPNFFKGKNEYLQSVKEITNLPVLRKDFIIDEYQIYESIILKADCILLICSILTDEQLKSFIKIANEYKISVLVETHNKNEIIRALEANAKIIGVNNRDLKTFTVNINNSINLRKLVPKDIIFISESGIKTKDDIKILKKNLVNGVLIGETFMKSNEKVKLINEFRNV